MRHRGKRRRVVEASFALRLRLLVAALGALTAACGEPGATSEGTSAVFRDGDDWAVFVDDGGRASLRHVKAGHRNSVDAEIVDGLAAGERVVLHPSDRLGDGVRVREP